MTAAVAERTIYNPVQRDRVTFLEMAADTAGGRTLAELEVAPGGGNMLHRHLTYAEHFEVLEGVLTVEVDGVVLQLGPGQSAVAPIRSLHRWANESDAPAVCLIEVVPGHRGFEQTLQIGYGLAADGLTRADGVPRRPYDLAVLAELSDIRLPPPMALLAPLMTVLARRARANGHEQALIERYVTF
jgi:mannose-6-phosphate isomerase-like protein (cupin superfamily)